MTADRYANPKLDCDIVMKGGITSGVVYPGAVLPLAEHYRFKCIGGTSAGGIAAAIVAAAEHARYRDGFCKLAELPRELATPVGGRSFMLQLFQADRETRPLFSVFIGLLQHGLLGGIRALRAYWRFPLVALTVAVASIVLAATAGADWAFAVAGLSTAIWICLIGVVADLVRAFMRLPANDFGLCRLGPGVGTEQAPALTRWLHQRIQATAGRQANEPPLTFADLWAGDEALPSLEQHEQRKARLLQLSRDPLARAVDLQMMTTDLTHGRPLRLPVPYEPHHPLLEDERGRLLFDPGELRRFFPEEVVEHLERSVDDPSGETAELLRQHHASHLKHFPIGADLPVVVATRMTLSFPILISAIPLYELDFGRAHGPELVRVIFSDGGITSNFPVHFFDVPLPTRPTFGLNLTSFEPGEGPDAADPCKAVRQPPNVNERAYQSVAQITDLREFFVAIKDAMQNWRDNAQTRLPGFRDRVISLKLATKEGGLNLTMDSCKIEELNARGRCAGEQLVDLFGDGTTKSKHWNDHRFVRYRTTMSLIERLLRRYDLGYRSPANALTTPYPDRVAEGIHPPYAFTEASLALALETTGRYVGLVADWNHKHNTLDDAGVPRPPSTLRAVPPV
jgi:predicted acylesterase/phospholipase RssA